jgi:membrane protease YdiL (CAAX protease family)
LNAAWVFWLALADTILLLALSIGLLRANGESPRGVFFGPRAPGREFVVGIALIGPLILGVALLLVAARAVWPSLHNVPDNPLAGLMGSPRDALLFFVVAIIGGGVREEIQRAFLLTRFEQHLGGPHVGLAVTSLAFGAGHALQGWDAAVATAVLGLLWGWIYLRRRSAVAPMVSHAGFNSLEIVRFLVLGPGGV